MTVTRLVPAKGIDILLKACAELKNRGMSMYCILLAMVLHVRIWKRYQHLGIYNETIFYGYTLHPEEFMPFFDIFVLPSRAEAFGSVFAEAALSCLALVGTNVGGIPEQIEDGVNGLLVSPDDEIALADALEKVISDPAYRYELSRSAWDKAKSLYSLTRVANELKKTYLQYPSGTKG